MICALDLIRSQQSVIVSLLYMDVPSTLFLLLANKITTVTVAPKSTNIDDDSIF